MIKYRCCRCPVTIFIKGPLFKSGCDDSQVKTISLVSFPVRHSRGLFFCHQGLIFLLEDAHASICLPAWFLLLLSFLTAALLAPTITQFSLWSTHICTLSVSTFWTAVTVRASHGWTHCPLSLLFMYSQCCWNMLEHIWPVAWHTVFISFCGVHYLYLVKCEPYYIIHHIISSVNIVNILCPTIKLRGGRGVHTNIKSLEGVRVIEANLGWWKVFDNEYTSLINVFVMVWEISY